MLSYNLSLLKLQHTHATCSNACMDKMAIRYKSSLVFHEREIEREGERGGRQTDGQRQTDRHRETERETWTERDREAETGTETQREREAGRDTERGRHRQTDRYRDRETDTERETDRQTDTSRPTERLTDHVTNVKTNTMIPASNQQRKLSLRDVTGH